MSAVAQTRRRAGTGTGAGAGSAGTGAGSPSAHSQQTAFPAIAKARRNPTTTLHSSTTHTHPRPRSCSRTCNPPMASSRSFAQRMAAQSKSSAGTVPRYPQHRTPSVATSIENWDDGDFDTTSDYDVFTRSARFADSHSARLSQYSESNTGNDDWEVLLTPNDASSTMKAISSAKQAGIPIPASVPSSALLGGSIKRLGKKPSNRKIAVDDDWGNDLELPADASQGLKLKAPTPRTPADDNDDFDDWGEGSLGIRFAGTRREARGGRSSSVSAMSPSMGSCMTLESEDDDLNGLVLPNEPLDFNARLEKLKRSEHPTPDISPLPSQLRRDPPPTSAPALLPAADFTTSPTPAWPAPAAPEPAPAPSAKPKGADDEEDFLDGLDFGGDEALDTKKLTLNRNVVVKRAPIKATPPPAARPATTLTFTDKPERPTSSKIPRPLSTSGRSRLTPVYESGAPPQLTQSRPMPTTTSAQLLRAKRSAPALRNGHNAAPRPPLPFLPAGGSNSQSHHVMTKASSQTHLRRDSDPRRPQSPSMRTYSRMSAMNSDTPSRAGMRRDMTPSAMARHPQKITQPKGPKRNYGDGSELEGFDDLPTSASKEKQFEKVPRNVASNKTLRQQPSNSRLPMPDRMATPQPQTPRSPVKVDSTPRFARDTAASRNAREQRLAGMRGRGDGPIAPTTGINWKVHVAAKSPHASPTSHRKKGTGQKPQLIRGLFEPYAKTEKGMVYNPQMQRWEGNEEALAPFTHTNTSTTTLALTTASTPTFAPPNNPFNHSHDRSHSISHTALSQIQAAQRNISSRAVKVGPASSPPRPALISQKSMPRGVQYDGAMVYDPVKMTWLKAPRPPGNIQSPVDVDEEEDPFAGIEELKDNESTGNHAPGAFGDNGISTMDDQSFLGEEFDVGRRFKLRQHEEEAVWRRKTEAWISNVRDNGEDRHSGWRWAIRHLAAAGQR